MLLLRAPLSAVAPAVQSAPRGGAVRPAADAARAPANWTRTYENPCTLRMRWPGILDGTNAWHRRQRMFAASVRLGSTLALTFSQRGATGVAETTAIKIFFTFYLFTSTVSSDVEIAAAFCVASKIFFFHNEV